ncbi:polycystin-1-like [Discoglossus pictus]
MVSLSVGPIKWVLLALLAASSLGTSVPPANTINPLADPVESQLASWDAQVDMGRGPRNDQQTEAIPDNTAVTCFSDRGVENGASMPRHCPPRCRCTDTLVNCSGAGLWEFPSAEDCPQDTVTMDLSYNHLTVLQPQDLKGYQRLQKLFLSHNQIQIIEEADVTSLPSLQKIDLSGNGLICSCALHHFVSLLTRQGSLETDKETELCVWGTSSSKLPCAKQYVSCVWGPPSSVLHYSLVAPTSFQPPSCLAFCFRYGHSFYAQDPAQRCLCGSITQRVSESCSDVCSSPQSEQVCNKKVILDPQPAKVTVSLFPLSHCSLFQLVEFWAEASVPITRFVWDFRDGGEPDSTAVGMIHHKFILPGKYMVRVQAEGQGLGSETLVKVTMPISGVELQCPAVAQTGQSVEVWLQVQQGTDLRAVYEVHQPYGHQLADDWSCPRGGRVFPGSVRCYWMSQGRNSWRDAGRQCRSVSGGDLARITSTEEINFLQKAFQGQASVWINVSRSLHGVNEGQVDHVQGQEMVTGCMRLQLAPGSVLQRAPCTQIAPSMCQGLAGAHLPDVSVYMLGLPFFSNAETQNITLVPALEDRQSDVEVMLFPGLWFSHSGSPLSLDFGVHPLYQTSQVRVQILRPFCSPEQHLVPPGCDLLRSPYAMCHSQPLCNTTGGCPVGQQWCPLSESCLNLTQPCSTYTFRSARYPPRYLGTPPSYSPVADITLELTPNPRSRNLQVLLSPLSLSVHPDDILSIQHSTVQGSLLRCAPSPGSPWSQSYISMMHRGWLDGSLSVMSHTWVDDVVCELRVTFVSEMRSLVISPLLSGFTDPGLYSVHATLHNAVSKTMASCDIRILSAVSDLRLVHPLNYADPLHVATQNSTLLVLSAQSSSPTFVQWTGPITTTENILHKECPKSLISLLPACSHLTESSGFTWAWLCLDKPQSVVITALVTNEISAQNLTLQVQSHEPIQGLSVQPEGLRYLQVHQTQMFTAFLSAGSSVTFTWTVDNMDPFTYQDPSYKVTFRTPGSYLLKIRAQNPVSSQELVVPLTVGGTLPLQNPELLLPLHTLLVNESQDIGFQIQVDSSSEVTISWDFGDGSPLLNRSFSPPYEPHLSQALDEPILPFLTNEPHHYHKEGYYQVTVTASNNASQVICSKKLQIVQPLTSMTLKMTPHSPRSNEVTLFSTICLPSSFAVTFSWNFGDSSQVVESGEPMIEHVYMPTGFYNLTVTGCNGRSQVYGTLVVMVGEMTEGMKLVSSGTGEIGTDIVITGSLQRGTDVMWSFNMGDGKSYFNQTNGLVRHVYNEEGNFTVMVIARNSLSSTNNSLIVQVYSICITNIFHPPIIRTSVPTQLAVSLNMQATWFNFYWEFGDDSPPIMVQGKTDVWHSYIMAGNYTLQVSVKGAVGSDILNCEIIVEDPIISFTITSSHEAANLSQPILFSSAVLPPSDPYHRYYYQWNFGVENLNKNTSSAEIIWSYMSEGRYNVTVTVWNGVSQEQAWCHVTVQRAINDVTIHLSAETAVPLNVEQVFTAIINEGVTAEFSWDFGDFSPVGTGRIVSHIFNVSADVTVRVLAQNKVSQSQSSVILSVLAPVTGLSLTSDQRVVELEQVVHFFTLMTSGDRVSYKWSVCESCPYKEGSSRLSHVFSNPGIVTVSVWAGNTVSSECASIIVEVQEKIEGISIHQKDLVVEGYAALDEPITLTVHIAQGSNFTYHWMVHPVQLESQNSSITLSPSILGDLQVEVQVQNALGTKSAQTQIQVIERVKGIVVQTDVDTVSLGTPVQFTAILLSGTEVQYSWDPGEGLDWQVTQTSSLTYTYLTPGRKLIRLTVSNVLSSGYASTKLIVQDPVSHAKIDVIVPGNMEAIVTNISISMCGTVQSGTNLVWEWTLTLNNNTVQYSGQKVSHVFMEPGQYQLWLHVWNNVSSGNATLLVNVEDTVSGLRVSTERSRICAGQEIIVSLSVQRGSNVCYVLTVPSLNVSMDLNGYQGILSFSSHGQYEVLVLAYNHVSRINASLSIDVLENVEGLQLLGLQSAWPVNQPMNLSVSKESGHFANFSWTFQELDIPEYSVTGQNVTYIPLREGTLHVLLNASNYVCSSSVSSLVRIQAPATSVTLSSNTMEVFLNNTVQFYAVTLDGSDLQFLWSFGDSEVNISSSHWSVDHQYSLPGDFIVHVFVYNLVSMVKAYTAVSVKTLQCECPRVQSVGGPSTMSSAVGGLFEVIVDLRNCTEYIAIYQWDVYKGSTCHSRKLNMPKQDTSSPLLAIPGHMLDIGSYCLLFTITLQGTGLSHNVTHSLLVTHSQLMAEIKGGSNRTWPVEMDLILDGRESYDPDLSDGEESNLEYQWISEPIEGEGPPCPLPSLPPLPLVSVPRTYLCDQSAVIFTMTIRKPGRETATAKQTVYFHSGPFLVVYLQCVSCNALSSTKISRSVHVILSGDCEACHNDTLYTWSAHDTSGHPLFLDNLTTSTGPLKRELVIRRGALQDGLGYTFTLRVRQQQGPAWGEGSISLTANNPPTGGSCSLLPTSNIFWLETPLEYNCTGWSDPDEDGQLLFSLSVQIFSLVSSQRLYLYRGTRSWHRVRSSVGTDTRGIQVFVEIEDMLGARTMAINRTLAVLISHTSSGVSGPPLLRIHGEIHQNLLKVVDSQQVLPHSMEIITALNREMNITEVDKLYRVSIRSNITRSLTSLHLSSLWDVKAISAALTQCVAIPQEVDSGLWSEILKTAEKMIHMLGSESEEGHRAEMETSKNILTLLGGAMSSLPSNDHSLFAFNLTRVLMTSLVKSQMLSEEPLSLGAPGVQVQGARVLPEHFLCTTVSEPCKISIPPGLSHVLGSHQELLQLVTELDTNPFSPGILPNVPVTSHLVALEFRSLDGGNVAVVDLPSEAEIQLRLPVKQAVNLTPTIVSLPPGDSITLRANINVEYISAGVHLYVSVIVPEGLDWALEVAPGLFLTWGLADPFNQSDTHGNQIFSLSPVMGNPQEFSLLLPLFPLSMMEYQVNITSLLSVYSVTTSVSLFFSLCQYFHMPSQTWRSEGVTPSNASHPHQIVCNTRHLTVFGASLFVPPHQIVLLPPAAHSGQRTLVLMTCSVILALYLLLVLISHKLDHLDVYRVGIVPLCGESGRYKYWVLLKTGWKRGAGSTAHVGISLYGLVKSGARHLDGGGTLNRGGVDVFQVETESNLGEIWKIRVWHDNTGLDPSWFLQYVAVLDRQTDFLYVFLVNDWLSVENEKNGGRVEKEVLAACPQELQSFSHVLPAQILLGFTDWHLWLSMWWRPARSRFTRVQRVTCCMLTLLLYITACAVWYGAVGVKGESSPVGARFVVTWQSVSVGVLVSVIVLPLQLLFTFLFRETRSKISLEETATSAPDTQVTEQDLCVDASSLLSIPGGGDSLMDISSHSCGSTTSDRLTLDLGDDIHWPEDCFVPPWLSSCDSIYDIPYPLSSESALGFSRTLRRKKGELNLGFQSVCSSGDDPLSLSGASSCSKRLTLSEENLLCSIAAETRVTEESDSGRFSPRTGLHSHSPESLCSPWSDGGQWSEARRWSFSSSCVSEVTSNDSELQNCCDIPSVPPSPFTTRIGVRWRLPGWLFPHWMLWVVYPVLFMLVSVCVVVTILYGSSLSSHGFLMWLISSFCALLTSFILLEPIKVMLLSICTSLYRPPVLSESEGLVEEPLVKKVSNHQVTVRAPGGYSLLQAKEEARRVRALRGLIKSCASHMVFFLLVLLVNYQSCFHDNNIRLLHTAIKQSVTRETSSGQNFTTLKSVADFYNWLDVVLPTHLYSDPRMTLLGMPRVCQHNTVPTGWTPLSFLQPFSKNVKTRAILISCEDGDPCTNLSMGNMPRENADHVEDLCQDLGNSSVETRRILWGLKAKNWIKQSVLDVEITQHHKDVQLHVSTILNFDFTATGTDTPSISILPFHLLETRHGLDLPLALALSLLFAALCFLCPKMVSIFRDGSLCIGHAPFWIHFLLGLFSGLAGGIHIVRTWLTRRQMDNHRAQPWAFTSLYEVALLSRAEVALTATLLLLIMLQAAQQLRFVRRWAVFGKTFRAVAGEILGSGFFLAIVITAVTHCAYLVAGGCPFLSIPCSPLLLTAFCGRTNLRPILQDSPLLGCYVVMGACVFRVCRALLCACVLKRHHKVQAESYRPALEPQDYEMIDFLVKRFKLWLGLSKTKEYRHTVRFEGFNSSRPCTSPSTGFPHTRRCSVNIHPPSPSSPLPEDLKAPGSPQSSNLAVERLPQAVTDLLDRLERVTVALTEVSGLESKLGLWHKTRLSREPHRSEGPSTSTNKQLPRTYSTFSESAITRLKSGVMAYDNCDNCRLSQRPAPDSADGLHRTRLQGATVSAGRCQRARLVSEATRRPHSEERSGGSKRNEAPIRPVPQKRRAWDPEKSGDT